jgi:hypothetical protein
VVERFGQVGPTSHRVRSISECGVAVDGADSFTVGETVAVRVGDQIAAAATVRWVGNGAAGLAFAVPIDINAARTSAN